MIEWRGEERQEMSMDVNKELQLYKKTVRFFSESANDYLYVLDLVNRRIHIADKICGKYPLPLPGGDSLRVLGRHCTPQRPQTASEGD